MKSEHISFRYTKEKENKLFYFVYTIALWMSLRLDDICSPSHLLINWRENAY